MAEEDDWPEFVRSNNQLRIFYELDQSMYKALRAGNDSDAQSTARTLLEYAELPLLLRARSCLVLACGDVSDFLEMAREAVRIAEIANNGANAGDGEAALLRDCRTIRDQAERDFNEIEEGQESEPDISGQAEDTVPPEAAVEGANTSALDRAPAHSAGGFRFAGGRATPSSSPNVSRMASLQADAGHPPAGPGAPKGLRALPSLRLSTAEKDPGGASVGPTPTTSMANAFTGFGLGSSSRPTPHPTLTPQPSGTALEDMTDPAGDTEPTPTRAEENAEMLDAPDPPESQEGQ